MLNVAQQLILNGTLDAALLVAAYELYCDRTGLAQRYTRLDS